MQKLSNQQLPGHHFSPCKILEYKIFRTLFLQFCQIKQGQDEIIHQFFTPVKDNTSKYGFEHLLGQ